LSDVFHHQGTKDTKRTKKNLFFAQPRETPLGGLGALGALVLKYVKEGLV
jgi:hypothetical protein